MVRFSKNFFFLLYIAAITATVAYGPFIDSDLTVFVFVVVGWMLSLGLHEFAHAFVAWKSGDYDHGTDKVMDFTLREDRLSFADIFGNQAQANLPFKDVLQAVNNGKIDVTATDSTHLTININNGAQKVDITLTDSQLTTDQVTALNQSHTVDSSHDAEKAALLQQMLTNLGG